MTNKPLISVVIPCYNVASTVAETIASVSVQTVADFEIIAVDNNCVDGTREVLSEIGQQESRLRVVEQPVQGLSAARNAGIAAARGDYIALLDADDLWDPNYLEAHLANMEKTGAGISYARLRFIDVAGCPTGQTTRPQLRGLEAKDLLRSNPCTAMIVVRSDVFWCVGNYNEDLCSVEDQEWLFRAAATGHSLVGIDQVLASYRIMPGGLSADLDAMLASHEQLLKAAAEIKPDLVARDGRQARASMLRYCARRAMEHGKGGAVARSYFFRMLETSPSIVVREPLTTLKVAVRIMLLWLGRAAPAKTGPLRAEEA